MLRLFRLRHQFIRTQRRYIQSTNTPGSDEKLRILFCGSDRFSVTHLEALHNYEQSGKSNIASIDVVTKPDKRSGRGLAILKAPAIKQTALDYGLPLHQVDTFTGWEPPDVNLIIAVSFGLLVPPRITNGSKFGGLNVHPSLLPDLRGAAPIHWAIIHGRLHTGVSIQTLHETKFDHGIILAQSEKIELSDTRTILDLTDQLARVGAKMLVDVIQNHLYLSPHTALVENKSDTVTAPKVRKDHRVVDFRSMTSDDIDRRGRAFDDLYAFIETGGRKRRLIFHPHKNIQVGSKPVEGPEKDIPVGVPYARLLPNQTPLNSIRQTLQVKTIDGKAICINDLTVEGKRQMPAAHAAARAHLLKDGVAIGDRVIYAFKAPLTAT